MCKNIDKLVSDTNQITRDENYLICCLGGGGVGLKLRIWRFFALCMSLSLSIPALFLYSSLCFIPCCPSDAFKRLLCRTKSCGQTHFKEKHFWSGGTTRICNRKVSESQIWDFSESFSDNQCRSVPFIQRVVYFEKSY